MMFHVAGRESIPLMMIRWIYASAALYTHMQWIKQIWKILLHVRIITACTEEAAPGLMFAYSEKNLFMEL